MKSASDERTNSVCFATLSSLPSAAHASLSLRSLHPDVLGGPRGAGRPQGPLKLDGTRSVGRGPAPSTLSARQAAGQAVPGVVHREAASRFQTPGVAQQGPCPLRSSVARRPWCSPQARRRLTTALGAHLHLGHVTFPLVSAPSTSPQGRQRHTCEAPWRGRWVA